MDCKTVERAAEQIMGEHDTDVAEALFAVRGRGGLRVRVQGGVPMGAC